MAYEEKLLRRYLAVHALAERGSTDGERFAAATRRGEMEEKYPGIGIDALRLQAQEKEKERAASPPPPPPPPPPRQTASSPPHDPNFGPYTAAGGNWGTPKAPPQTPNTDPGKNRWTGFGDFLGEAWMFAKDVTQTVVNAEAGRIFAERVVRLEGNTTAAGNYRLAAVSTVQELMAARAQLNDAQKQAFAKAVGDMVAAQVYALLSPDLNRGP
jgi:hypothetical protein